MTTKPHDTTSVAIDWLTFTLPYPPELINVETYIDLILTSLGDTGKRETAKPYPHNYDKALQGDYFRISFSPDRPDNKLCFNLTGANCNAMYQDDIDFQWLLGIILGKGAKITRLDIAIDYYKPCRIETIYNHLIANPKATKARTLTPYHQVDLDNKSDTMTGVYIGSRSSDRFICLYDKAIQLEQDDRHHKRIEIRNKGQHASAIAIAIQSAGEVIAGRSAIAAYCKPSVEWWQDAIKGEAIAMPKIPRKDTDTMRWLLSTVLPVIERELNRAEDTDILYKSLKTILDNARGGEG